MRWSRLATSLALAVAFSAGAAVRIHELGQKSLWLDEAFSLAISQRSLLETLQLTVLTDTHPPLYYLILNLWLRWDTGEAWARLLSALFSIAGMPMMYKVGRALHEGTPTGVLAAVILALSPFHIWYAQEARMYAMLSFFVLASSYFLLVALRRGGGQAWLGHVLSTTLALYTDNGAIWYVLATDLFFLSSLRLLRGKVLGWALSQLAVAILYAPWLPSLWLQTQRVTESFWLPAPSFPDVLQTFLDFNSFNLPWLVPSVVYMAAILVFAYVVPDPRGWQRRLVSLWLFAPLAASLLISLRQPIFLSRNLISASLGYCLLTAGTISRFKHHRPVVMLLTPLLLMNLFSVAYNTRWESKEDWRAAAAHVASQAQDRAEGLIVFLPSYAELPFQYYFRQYGVSLATQGYPQDEILLHEPPRRVDSLDALFADQRYVWLVLRKTDVGDSGGVVKTWLDTHGYVRLADFQRPEIAVIGYVRWDVETIRRDAATERVTGLTKVGPATGGSDKCPTSPSRPGAKQPPETRETRLALPGDPHAKTAPRRGATMAGLTRPDDLAQGNRVCAAKEPVAR